VAQRGTRNGNFRKFTADEFGKSDFWQELERVLLCQEKQGTGRHTMSKRRGVSCLAFCSALKEKLRDWASNFGKENLKLLVAEIWVNKKGMRLSGSYAFVRHTLYVNKTGATCGIAQFCIVWHPSEDGSGHWEELLSL
jgi:hypothetical protein